MSKLVVYPIQGEFGDRSKDFYLTQGYGLTDFAKSKQGKALYKYFPGGIHPGLDFGTHGINLPAIATCDGKIVWAKENGGWGKFIEVQGADGWRRHYGHLSSISVKEGQMVKRGDVLGRVGTTGSSTAVHLHYGHRRWSTLGKWEYRDPSFEIGTFEIAEWPKAKFIKSVKPDNKAVYIFNGKTKYPIPDWETFLFLADKPQKPDSVIELVDDSILSKIPQGPLLTSLKN